MRAYYAKVGAHSEHEQGQEGPQRVAVYFVTLCLGQSMILVAHHLVGSDLVLFPKPDCQQHRVLEQGQGHEQLAKEQPNIHCCEDPGLE